MLNLSSFTFIDILELIGTIATVLALVYAVKSFRKSTRIQEAVFVQNLFENFKRDRQAILDNPRALQILAKERGVSTKEFISASIGSFDISRAYLIFHLNERNLIPKEQWERDIKDMQVLFFDDLVVSRWEQVKTRYPEAFQAFIAQHIKTSSKKFTS